MGVCGNLNKSTKGSHSVSTYMKSIQILANTEVIFYVLDGLGSEFKEIIAAICVRDTYILC